jgi:hypothetical protein
MVNGGTWCKPKKKRLHKEIEMYYMTQEDFRGLLLEFIKKAPLQDEDYKTGTYTFIGTFIVENTKTVTVEMSDLRWRGEPIKCTDT